MPLHTKQQAPKKQLFKLLRCNQGMSTLEIMVTVTIIAIMGSIAVYSYSHRMRQAQSVEARNLLSEIYIAEKNFYSQFRFYTHDLFCTGLQSKGTFIYNAGFHSAMKYPSSCTDMSCLKLAHSDYDGPSINFSRKGDLITLCSLLKDTNGDAECQIDRTHANSRSLEVPTSSTIGSSGFTILAVGYFSTTAPQDVWQMDQNKNLSHTSAN